MRPSSSVADLLQSFGFGRSGGGGGLPSSNSMIQLLAALDSPTGRLTDAVATADAERSAGLPSMPSSTSLTNIRTLLRNASSTGSLADLADSSVLELSNFAALARSASLQACAHERATTAHNPTGSFAAAASTGASTGAGAGSASGGQQRSPTLSTQPWGSTTAEEGLLLPTDRLPVSIRESPSVSSLVDLVRSSSATSLVELIHSYSATNLASLVKDETNHE